MVQLPDLPSRFENCEPLASSPLERRFRAFDNVLEREVMIKLPAIEAAQAWSAEQKARLLREAQAIAKVRHEGIAPIHWVEQTPDGPLLVLDLTEGEPLADRLSRGPLEVDETITLGIAIGEALAAVHYSGIVHRNVGPSSIQLLASGKAQLGAFTFAKDYGHDQVSSLAHRKRDEAVVAAALPAYSAPEQLAGQPADPRADVFALGCTLFRCLTGREAFEPGHEHEPPADLRKLRKDAPKKLVEVIRRCTMHAKTARYATAQQVVEALKELRAGPARGGGGSRRGMIAGVVVVVMVAIGAVFAGDLWSDPPKDRGGEDRVPTIEDGRYAQPYGSDYARVHGLFVGIGEAYAGTSMAKLANPVREVEAVTAQLRANDPQWEREGAIKILKDGDATWDGIAAELERLVGECEPEDAVLIYFAGHGVRDGRSFGLCAADVEGTIGNGTGFLRRDRLVTYLDRMDAKHALVILDCCHSGAIFAADPTRGRDPGLPVVPPPGAHHRRNFSREFLCSAAASEKASDGRELSPFCTLLLAELGRGGDEGRDYLAAKYLSARIAEAMDQRGAYSNRVQVSCFRQMSEQEGSFVFLLGGGK